MTLQPRASDLPELTRASDLPDDVRAELDAEARRTGLQSPIPTSAEPVPEDVLGERDLETRLGTEDLRQRLSEGQPPAEEEPRS